MTTKPVISYVANKIPLNTELNVSIVQKKIDKTTFRNWNDKTEFTDYVDSLYVHPRSDCYVYIKCQCDTEYVYANKTAVPVSNITCSCGRKVIKYGS